MDQFVIHFDVAGVSRNCFNTLQDHRDLSVHFMLDIDGTIYQTLDLKERAAHATIANGRSVGIEIANMGSVMGRTKIFRWTSGIGTTPNGQTTITLPASSATAECGRRICGPSRAARIDQGQCSGRDLVQYDFTPQQYAALVKLTATLCTVLPKIQCRYPDGCRRETDHAQTAGRRLNKYQGVLGHYHIQTDKWIRDRRFNWDYVIGNARKIMAGSEQ